MPLRHRVADEVGGLMLGVSESKDLEVLVLWPLTHWSTLMGSIDFSNQSTYAVENYNKSITHAAVVEVKIFISSPAFSLVEWGRAGAVRRLHHHEQKTRNISQNVSRVASSPLVSLQKKNLYLEEDKGRENNLDPCHSK